MSDNPETPSSNPTATTEAAAEVTNSGAAQPPVLTVSLPAWEWHHLLKEMEEFLNIVNRDQTNLRLLYARIATQLAGYEVAVPEERRYVSPFKEKKEPERRSWLGRLLD